jgi:hypothetical protein
MTAVTPAVTEARTRRPPAARLALALVAAAQAEIGVWGLIAPHSLFAGYPVPGHHWISELGAYNQHLVRDYAATELGFAVLLFSAAIWFDRRVVLIAGVAFLSTTLPHFAYHLTTTSSFTAGDNAASLGGFMLEIVLVYGAMVSAARLPPR